MSTKSNSSRFDRLTADFSCESCGGTGVAVDDPHEKPGPSPALLAIREDLATMDRNARQAAEITAPGKRSLRDWLALLEDPDAGESVNGLDAARQIVAACELDSVLGDAPEPKRAPESTPEPEPVVVEHQPVVEPEPEPSSFLCALCGNPGEGDGVATRRGPCHEACASVERARGRL